MDGFEFNTSVTVNDDRIRVSRAEAEEIRKKYLRYDDGPRMDHFPKKQKIKLVLLQYISEIFHADRRYSEKEVNALLEKVYADYVTLRRYMVDYGFLHRTPDGAEYWK